MSRFEKKWPFSSVVALLTLFTTRWVLDAAGMPPLGELRPAQWVLYFFCFCGIWRVYAFLGWLAVLGVAPSLVVPAKEAER